MSRGSMPDQQPKHAAFTPSSVGRWYMNPACYSVAASVSTLSRMYLHAPHFSGRDGLTIDQVDINVTIVAASSVVRVGFYQIRDQLRPFKWSTSAVYADLLLDVGATAAGTFDTSSGTGQKTLTLTTALVIPANTWFSVAGVEQGGSPTRVTGNLVTASYATPFGTRTAGGYATQNSCIALINPGVTGALPATFTPDSTLSGSDSGVGFRRSA